MAEFSSLGEFGQTSKPNEMIEEKQGISFQSLPNEVGFQSEVRNETISKDNNQGVGVELSKNDLRSSGGNVVDDPVQTSNAISDSISLERLDVSLGFGHTIDNQGEGAPVSVQDEQPGDDIFLDGLGVCLNFDDASDNPVDSAHVSVQPGDVISMVGEDVSLKFEDASATQAPDAHVSLQGEHPKDGNSMEGEDVVLTVEQTGECALVSVQGEQLGGVMSLEGEDAGLKFENVSENQGEGAHESLKGEELGRKETADSEAGLGSIKVEQNVESKDDAIISSQLEGVHIPLNAQSTPPPQETAEKVRVVVLACLVPNASDIPRRGRKPGKAAAKSQQLSLDSARALRPRSKENSEDPEQSVDLEATKGSTGRRGRKKGMEKDGKPDNEFSRMKKHLIYLLHRIHYEQNLLDAYSSEGWRGQSVEKLRPEKELQRAKADINRSKLKIRNLFQKIDSLSAEGKFPESLYDSEGLIDSEDIFCAKCGSKDLPPGNDIILCDGICERGFHQYCLDPPLRTEEIPPGDEGWLCPACDCKHDCVDLINDSHGTKLFIEDSWEKVFPEAIAAKAGKELDDVMGLPSDDSEDNEYSPDGADDDDDDANVEGNGSSSDKSDSDESDSSEFSSASEDLEAICGVEKNLGLPSDDSEDDDFNPDAKNHNEEEIEHESSSSDFTSASEDLGAAVGDDGASGKDDPLTPPVELEQDLGESSLLTSKRCVERLDYKKLYDETYGNADLDSSDDEDWTDMVPTRKRKGSTEKNVSASSLGASASADGVCGSGAPQRRRRLKAKLKDENGSPVHLQESSPKTSPSGSGKKRPPYNRLGEAVTQRLYVAFKENQYPDREAKEKLADELGLTAYRVDKWFGNARWSFNHHPSRIEASISRAVSQSNQSSVACNGGESALASNAKADPECTSADTTKLDSTRQKSTRNCKKNKIEGDQPMPETTNTGNSKEGTQTDPLQTPDPSQVTGQRKRRKSGA